MTIKREGIPFLPCHVDISDLGPNGRLLSDDVIARLKTALKSDGRYRYISVDDAKIRLNYAVIVQGSKRFAIYKGKKNSVGEGGYGTVKLAQDLETGEWHALKVQIPTHAPLDPLITAKNELSQLAKIHMTIKAGKANKPVAFERYSHSKHKIQHYMLMKFAKGNDLCDLYNHNAFLPLIIYLKIILNALQEVKYLQHKKILHRDIKIENMRYNKISGEVTLIDLGLSVDMNKAGKYIEKDDCRGTSDYVAPELKMMNKKCIYNAATEMFALGISFGFLLKLLDEVNGISMDKKEILHVLNENDSRYLNDTRITNARIRKKIADFLRRMINENPEERPDVNEVIEFFTGLIGELNPEDRIVKIGVLSVEDYLKARDDVYVWDKLISNLKECQQVWLMDAEKKYDSLEYVKIKQVLENEKIPVGDEVFYGDLEHKIVEKMEELIPVKDSDYIYSHFQVKPVAPSVKSKAKRDALLEDYSGFGFIPSIWDNFSEGFSKLGFFNGGGVVAAESDSADIALYNQSNQSGLKKGW